jgi:flagella basal body P-ring formation protein FlgA
VILVSRVLLWGSLFFAAYSSAVFALSYEDVSYMLKQDIIRHIMSTNPLAATSDIFVKIINEGSVKKATERANTVQLIFSNNDALVGGTILPLLALNEKGEVISKTTAIFQTTLSGWYVRAKKFIPKGKQISQDDVEEVYENTHAKSIKSLRTAKDIAHKITAVSLAKGAYLTETSVKEIPLIPKGSSVTIWYSENMIELKLKGKAVADGYLSKTVTVQPFLNDNKLLEGEIIDSQNVRVRALR